MEKSIICPLCGATVKHQEHKKANFWACQACPFVGFEFYSADNIHDLEQGLYE